MKIYLVCSGGMSTSLLVERMRKEAVTQSLDCQIEAASLTALEAILPNASCLLVAPQVRHRFAGIASIAEKQHVPVAVIDGLAYGKIDGKAILEQAMQLAKP